MKKKILIADADEQFSTELMAALQACDMFEVVGLATDGEQAIQRVMHKRSTTFSRVVILILNKNLLFLLRISIRSGRSWRPPGFADLGRVTPSLRQQNQSLTQEFYLFFTVSHH